jgi:SET domain-containing protein
MLQVKTYLDKSPIHGTGVFAAQDIKKGDLIWRFIPTMDKRIDVVEMIDIAYSKNKIQRDFIDIYSFYDKQLEKWILPTDNYRFTNHSIFPNAVAIKNGDIIANKDIIIDEELTVNYFEIDGFAEDKILKLKKANV